MATNLIRNVSKTLSTRQSPLSRFQKRNSSSSPTTSDVVSSQKSSLGIPLAVGVSLGLSVGLMAQSNLVNKLLPNNEPVPEKTVPAVDPKILDEFINLSRRTNQLEVELINMRQDLREREHQITQAAPAAAPRSDINVIELSQVIDAINIAHNDRHAKALDEQRKSMLREHLLKVEGEVLKVENKYRPVLNKVKELEVHLEAQNEIQQKEAPARLLWLSCQALLGKMRHSPQAPLEKDPDYDVLKRFAANNNRLAISVLDSIPAKALKEGVQSEESLIDRFSKVEKVCKRVALVGENGGGIAKYLVSYLQSVFVFDNVKVTEDEVTGRQLVDPTLWNTFDILGRVRYCLLKHNLEQAIRYANQLKGQARVVARDWIRDARVHLETRQAFSALSTHAEAIAVDATRQAFVKS